MQIGLPLEYALIPHVLDNLLGRDLLCQVGVKICYTLVGVFTEHLRYKASGLVNK